jgi:hypothetical protein
MFDIIVDIHHHNAMPRREFRWHGGNSKVVSRLGQPDTAISNPQLQTDSRRIVVVGSDHDGFPKTFSKYCRALL